METITSAENQLAKKLQKLKDRKYRRALGEYVAEGMRWVDDLIDTDSMRDVLSKIVIKASVSAALLDKWAGLVPVNDIAVFSDPLYEKLCDTENSQGVTAVLKIRPQGNRLESPYCLYLDRIRDPGNMGTILRTACAAGFRDVICDGCVDAYNPKAIRSCMTGILHLRLYENVALTEVKAAGYRVLAADPAGEDFRNVRLPQGKYCLVIGNEANGVSPSVLGVCDGCVSLPMADIESLNASVSAGVLMYWLKFIYS